jgi:hypothetical protein
MASVASDATSIYENGHLISLSVGDLLKNEVAIRQLINSHNLACQDKVKAQDESQELRQNLATLTLQPMILILLSVASVVGAALVGLGTNYISSAQPPPGAGWILFFGICLILFPAIATPLIPVITTRNRRK